MSDTEMRGEHEDDGEGDGVVVTIGSWPTTWDQFAQAHGYESAAAFFAENEEAAKKQAVKDEPA